MKREKKKKNTQPHQAIEFSKYTNDGDDDDYDNGNSDDETKTQ